MAPDESAPSDEPARAAAERAQARAYAPHSGFAVGAAVVTASGEIFTGANIENASYSLSMCAERVAVFRAVSAGHLHLGAITVTGAAADLSPCGACRQVLAEFGGSEMAVTYRSGGEYVTKTLGELLPESFRLEP